ncbi:MAG TPA: TonB C-terminal domain-containing protein [Polyangiaceae bacterium]|jgi:TonB family protein|nr:TonB C-terminal domain-containing protein [Polyangiaceae bacterium]
MNRETNIPLFLWIATALLFHLSGGEGAQRIADLVSERLEVQRFADSVRRHVLSSNRPVEVSLVDEKDVPRDEALPDDTEPKDEADSKTPEPPLKKPDETAPPKKPDEKQSKIVPPHDKEKEKPPSPEKTKTAEKEKPPEPKKEDKAKAQDIPAVPVPNRIAVVQHVDDKTQKDNPNAQFIADEANTVKEQTQARITATDQNDANPTPGSAPQGPSNDPGNSEVNEVAQSEDSPGVVAHAPNEHSGGQKAVASIEHNESGPQKTFREVAPNSHRGQTNGAANGPKQSQETTVRPGRDPVAASRATPQSPDMEASRAGSESVNEASDERMAHAADPGRPKRLPPARGEPNAIDFLGLGATGMTSGGINLNLTPGSALAAVGRDQLQRELLADGERRRSQHRGSWHTDGIERWRAAIENYNSSVKPGNQTALNAARVPFASYLNQIHNRIHPIFADSFLGSLDSLPADSPLNKPDMRTNLEIVLDKDEGKIVKMGVTRSSGSTVFDVAALESVQNAAPFGKPPPIIVSPDGKVYLHWEFYRNPYYACSTYFAHPYMLKATPETAPSHVTPPSTTPFGPKEEAVPEHGSLERPDRSLERASLRIPGER